jgi:capsular polysaccharide biosynthesis protein
VQQALAATGYHEEAVAGLAGGRLRGRDVTVLDQQAFAARLAGPSRGGIAVLGLAEDSEAHLRLAAAPPRLGGEPGQFITQLYGLNTFRYPAQLALLIDEPCYVVPGTGVVFLADGRPLLESVYPSSGEPYFYHLTGLDCDSQGMARLLETAPEVTTVNVPTLAFSRWSQVFTHAMVECLVHDAALRQLGLAALATYLVPEPLHGSQNLVAGELARLGQSIAEVPSQIVRVPRVLSTTLLYQYETYGENWGHLVQELVGASASSGAELVYASRIGSPMRPMDNERELAAELKARGFHIFTGAGHTLREQIDAYRNARMIVGAHGSGLLNAGFARPGGLLFELRPLNRPGQNPMWDTCFMNLSARTGLQYLAHISANPIETQNWRADLDVILPEVDRRLADLMASGLLSARRHNPFGPVGEAVQRWWSRLIS